MADDKFILHGPPVTTPSYPRSTGVFLFEKLKEYAKDPNAIASLNVATLEQLSYKDLFEKSCRVAISLKRLGFAGKTIAICSENHQDFFIPVVAALYLGSPIATFNHGYTERELLHACELVQPAFIFCSKSTWSNFKMLRNKYPMKYLQQLWILENLGKLVKSSISIAKFQAVDVDINNHIGSLLFSSGTTGLPKAVMLTHLNMNSIYAKFFDSKHLLFRMDNTLMCLPFYHGYGFHVGLASLLRGIPMKFMVKFDDKVFLASIEKYKVSYLTMVPPLMVFLAKHPLVDRYDLSAVKIIVCAGAALSKELEMQVVQRLKSIPRIYQGYGLTETTLSVISVPGDAAPRDGSIGKADAGSEIRVRDPATDRSLPPNTVGEICARGPMIMKGYMGNVQATNETIGADGWLYTGDLGYYDADGYLYIVDRLKELIKFKGFQVPPAELEAVLLTHPKIMDAGVVGLPDEAAGELPMAFIVKKPGVELNEQEVKDFIKGQVSHAKRLHGGVRFVDVIPKSPAGKILRRELRAMQAKPQKSKL